MDTNTPASLKLSLASPKMKVVGPRLTLGLTALTMTASVSMADNLEIIARSGDTAPRGEARYFGFQGPVIANSGHVAFVSGMSENGFTRGDALLRTNADRSRLDLLIVRDDVSPALDGNVRNVVDYQLANDGSAVAEVDLQFTLDGGSSDKAYWLIGGSTTEPSEPFREGQFLADQVFIQRLDGFSINGEGKLAAQLLIRGKVPDPSKPEIVQWRSLKTIQLLEGQEYVTAVAEGQSFAVENEDYYVAPFDRSAFTITDDSHVLFDGAIAVVNGSLSDARDSFIGWNAADGLFEVFGRTLINIDELTYLNFLIPVFSESGDMAVYAQIVEGDRFAGNRRITLNWVHGRALHELVREGEILPSKDGRFATFSRSAVNNSGQIAFASGITGTTPNRDEILGLASQEELKILARKGDSAPGGGVFTNFFIQTAYDTKALNDRGQMVFAARVLVGETHQSGLFFYDPTAGLFLVARTGLRLQPDMEPLDSFRFKGGGQYEGIRGSGFNQSGEIAFEANVGRESLIIVWSPEGVQSNLPPEGMPFKIAMHQGETARFHIDDLIAQINDPEGGALVVASIATKSQQGFDIIKARSSDDYTYTPAISFLGSDHFSYEVIDPLGAVTSFVVEIEVTPAPPLAGPWVGYFRDASTVEIERSRLLELLEGFENQQGGLPRSQGDWRIESISEETATGLAVASDEEKVVASLASNGLSDTLVYQIADDSGYTREVALQLRPWTIETVTPTETHVRISIRGDLAFILEKATSLEGPWEEVGEMYREWRNDSIMVREDQLLQPQRAAFYRVRPPRPTEDGRPGRPRRN